MRDRNGQALAYVYYENEPGPFRKGGAAIEHHAMGLNRRKLEADRKAKADDAALQSQNRRRISCCCVCDLCKLRSGLRETK